MCVLAFAWEAHPRWQLVLTGNRDELHARPAAPLARWQDKPHIIAGRDLEAGGTWLGVSEDRRCAVVTNVANPDGPEPGKASRGALIADLLDGTGRYACPTESDVDDFNPFNVIAVENGTARLLTNHPKAAHRTLDNGIYGISNGMIDDDWPKTKRIKALLQSWLEADSGDEDRLLDSLRADDSPQVESLRTPHGPIFIRNTVYGTRCSTVVTVDRRASGKIVERRYGPEGGATGQTRMEFNWAS